MIENINIAKAMYIAPLKILFFGNIESRKEITIQNLDWV